MEKKPVAGLIARPAIQCTDHASGEKGDFLFSGDYPESYSRRSPVFSDLMDLYTWARENDWKSEGEAYVYRP